MKLYNTPVKQIQDFRPLIDGKVSLYTCGPTVYDYQHIGNYFGYIHWDVLVRVLEYQGYEVNRIMNITDVGHLVSDADEGEDKLEKGAAREGKTAWEVAEFYTMDFKENMDALGLLRPHYTAATDHIKQQIELIKKLEAKDYTYIIDDGVYFDTAKFPSYGDFASLDLAGQKEGARVALNEQKRQPSDFALWKFSPEDKTRAMQWESPWGKGFPGWHLECSAMAMEYLGATIDIHTGGIDHIPVHHTNEIAQCEAVTNKKFVNYWLHNNHLLVDNAKISKSLGNGYTLAQLGARGFSPMDYKLFALQSHYRSQAHFSWENLEAAQNRLKRWRQVADLRFQLQAIAPGEGDIAEMLIRAKIALVKYLQEDLNAPEALALIDSTFDGMGDVVFPYIEKYFNEFIEAIDTLLGLDLCKSQDITKDQKDIITKREAARQNNDWSASDELRSQLSQQGIGMRDSPDGPIWYRV